MESYVVTFPGLGLEFTLNRVAFSIGGLNIYWYGLLIATGLMLAVIFAFRHAVEFGIDVDRLINVVCIGTIMAIVCARIYYVAMSPYQYSSFWEMLNLRDGGIAIYGAIFGAFVFGGLACKGKHIPLLATYDLVAMGFLIGQGIGRWGNFVNQEAFGCNTTLPWGMYSAKTQAYLETAVVTVPKGVTIDPTLPVHPTFLYESLWCLAGFVMLALYFKKRKFNGDVALRYAIWYGLGRFWIEGLRTDSLLLVPSLGLRASQLVAAVTVFVSIALEILLTRRYRDQQPLKVALALSSENLKHCSVREKGGRMILTVRGKDGPAVLAVSCDTMPANATHEAFVNATREYNEKVEKLLKERADAEEKTAEAAAGDTAGYAEHAENAAPEAAAPEGGAAVSDPAAAAVSAEVPEAPETAEAAETAERAEPAQAAAAASAQPEKGSGADIAKE